MLGSYRNLNNTKKKFHSQIMLKIVVHDHTKDFAHFKTFPLF